MGNVITDGDIKAVAQHHEEELSMAFIFWKPCD
jgi:hypothetical protein